MNQVYVLLKKMYSNNVMVPGYEIIDHPPAQLEPKTKLATLEPGEYVEVSKCEVSSDLSELRINAYRVINQDGVAREEYVESYSLERLR
jgi:hypothetical protein